MCNDCLTELNLMCDYCSLWFHGEYLNLSDGLYRKKDRYRCPLCLSNIAQERNPES